jgi:hypothetical protein
VLDPGHDDYFEHGDDKCWDKWEIEERTAPGKR